LQEILSAVHRNNINNRTTRGASEKPRQPEEAAFIPTPDSTGVVDNYEEFYSSKAWKDPASYVSTSQTVEEHIAGGIANGFTYYMDERDKEWLDKNNEQARGEGTSAEGAVSPPLTRTSTRSSKAKGKEPEAFHPVVISEDEFELVMGVFEKATHERTEFLHHVCAFVLQAPSKLTYSELFRISRPAWTFQHFRNMKMCSPLRCLPRRLLPI
jgi:enhancer of polycomb-like protein